MTKESKILLFKDKGDYIKKITNDAIFNVTGEKGSGKTYFGSIKDSDNNCAVIHLDPLFSANNAQSQDKDYKYTNEMRSILVDKYGKKLDPDKYFESDYYLLIVNYLKNTNKTGYIEGGSISEIENVNKIIGSVVVKRTGVFKCFIRAIKRDYNNNYFMKQEIELHGKFAKIVRLYKVIKRRKKIFKTYHYIEQFIERLEKI